MPLYQLDAGSLVGLTRLHPGPELFEKEIEDLIWNDLEAFTGDALFRVARQPHIDGGGIPDILALDRSGRIVVIEVKRDVDRKQLAQALEYAGWARNASLDEVADLYDAGSAKHQGREAFYADWQAYTESTGPEPVNSKPRVMLVARDFGLRTRAALDFLIDSGVDVAVFPTDLYEDRDGHRFVDIDADHEPTPGPTAVAAGRKNAQHGVSIADLIDANLVQPPEPIVFTRPRLGEEHHATIQIGGTIVLADGTEAASPSAAAMKAADIPSYDGWLAWRIPRLGDARLDEIRAQYLAEQVASAPTEDDARDE